MQRSIYLAKLIGPPMAAIGAGLLVNGATFRAMAEEFLRGYALIFLAGLLALVAGLAIVQAHNVWSKDWRVIITVFGWLALIGGAVRIVVPQLAAQVGTAMFAQSGIVVAAGLVMIALGAFLSFKGYWQ